MKVQSFPSPETITITQIITFDPWPFASSSIHMADEVAYIDYVGEIHAPGSWTLGRDADERLAVLSTGQLVVLSDEFDEKRTLIIKEWG